MTIGIVLGAGGTLGWAYHLGVAEGVAAAAGCELRTAARIVGTSAGGAIAVSLLAGASTADVLSTIARPPSDEEMARMREARDSARRGLLRRLRPQSARMLRRGGIRGLVGLLPAGVFPTESLRRFPGTTLDAWPDQLWMPSVELDSGEVVVFGRDRSDVPVADAVEATSAMPGLFEPKHIDGRRYIDGAVASATHADLLVDEDLERVLIASPMTRPGRGPIRRRARRQLRREVAALEAAGVETTVLEPSAALMAEAEGWPRSRPEAGAAIVATARAQTVAALS